MSTLLKKPINTKRPLPTGAPHQGRLLREDPFERIDLRLELDTLEKSIEETRIHFEQFFTGIIPLAPEQGHADLRRQIRRLLKAPLKNSEMRFRLRTLETRYQTLNSYWKRVLREKEEGTYSKDVFKANVRDKVKHEELRARTSVGQASLAMQQLFSSYKETLERHTGRAQNLDFYSFQKVIAERAKEFKQQNQGQKVSFKIVVEGGKVSIRATSKG